MVGFALEAPYPRRESLNTYWIRIRVGPRAGLDVVVIYDIYS